MTVRQLLRHIPQPGYRLQTVQPGCVQQGQQLRHPLSAPQRTRESHDFRPCATRRIICSHRLLSTGTRSSSRYVVSAANRFSAYVMAPSSASLCTVSQHGQPYCGLTVRFTTKCAGTYSGTSFTPSRIWRIAAPQSGQVLPVSGASVVSLRGRSASGFWLAAGRRSLLRPKRHCCASFRASSSSRMRCSRADFSACMMVLRLWM